MERTTGVAISHRERLYRGRPRACPWSILSLSVILDTCPRLDRGASRFIGSKVFFYAGFRPRTTKFFCFGKRTQNHWRPGVSLRVPWPQSRLRGLRNFLRQAQDRRFAQTVLAPKIEVSGLGRSHARRRRKLALACFVSLDVRHVPMTGPCVSTFQTKGRLRYQDIRSNPKG